jgi:formylglycine-generating enzyme required for sulfatase activity
MRIPAFLILLCLGAIAPPAGAAPPPGEDMVRIPGGSYRPMFVNGAAVVRVRPFAMDRHPVSRREYAAFLRANPDWRRSRLRRVYADSAYLGAWPGDADPGAANLSRPVTQVSWFAAKRFCAWRGKRLPATDEWEFVARASETDRNAVRSALFSQRLLSIIIARVPTANVGSTFQNAYGVWDMHGLAWEWTLDFNSLLVSTDSRATSGRDHALFCAAGVIGATDPNNYPAYLRYGYRAGLDGRSVGEGLGFRCAQDL